MRASQLLVWGLLALTTDAKRRHRRRTACPPRSTRTSIVQVTVTRGSALPVETPSESQILSISASADVSTEVSSQVASTLISVVQSSSVTSSSPAGSPTASTFEPTETIESALPSSSTETSAEAPSPSSSSVASSSSSSAVLSFSTTSTAVPVATNAPRAYPADSVDDLRDESIKKLEDYLGRRPANNGCTLENVAVRREWYAPLSHAGQLRA